MALGLLLVVAGVLKAHHLATEPVAGSHTGLGRLGAIGEAEVEIAFGIWMLGGLMPRLTSAAALGCFVLFSGVTREILLALPNLFRRRVGVRRALSECTCLTAAPLLTQVPPGTDIVIQAVIVAPKKRTRYNQRLWLATTPPARPAISIWLRADVDVPLLVEPRTVDFGLIQGPSQQTVTIRNRSVKPIRLTDAPAKTTQMGICRAAIPSEISPRKAVSVRITVLPAAPGRAEVDLRIHTDHAIQSSLRIPATFQIAPK